MNDYTDEWFREQAHEAARRLAEQINQQYSYNQQAPPRRSPTRAELLEFMQSATALAAIARTATQPEFVHLHRGPIHIIGGVNGDIRLVGSHARGKPGDHYLGRLEVMRSVTTSPGGTVFRFVAAA